MKTSILFLISAVALASFYTSCKKDDHIHVPSNTVYSSFVPVGEDSIRSFITTENGQPVSIGLEIGENALNGLPTDTTPGKPDYEYEIPLPGTNNITGVDHIEVDWNPFGHDPYPIYGIPHFDFHFYYINKADQAAVIPGPDTITVSPEFIPKDYISSGAAVPDMGTHWFDTTASELHGMPFTATFIYGFYHGNFSFIEPMMTKAFLETHPDFSADVKQPQAFQRSGYYATSYQAKYDGYKKIFTITLGGLANH